MTVKLLTEHHLELLSLKGGYTGSSESTKVYQSATLLKITCRGLYLFLHICESSAYLACNINGGPLLHVY